MALGPGEGPIGRPGVLCVTDQGEGLGVILPSGQESWSLQVPYLSEARKICRQGDKPGKALPLAWSTQSAGGR